MASSRLNNPNVINPYGTQTYTEGVTPQARPTLLQQFSPEQQALYAQNLRTQGLLGGLAQQGATAAQGVVGTPVSFGGVPPAPGTAQETRNQVYNAMMGRVEEDLARQTDQARSDLIAAGIRPGSKAYDDRMALIERQRTDARQQAILASGQQAQQDFAQDMERRRAAIGEYLSQRQVPLNEIAALLSGSQVQNPFAIPGYAQNAQVAAAPLFAATQAAGNYAADLYNAQAAQQAALTSGLFQLGAGTVGGIGTAGGIRPFVGIT